ncbi:MAG: hypothetical protein IKD18_05290 [Clostridia bacterium]|nr:hypothetical protein [Clostridia bacterium]
MKLTRLIIAGILLVATILPLASCGSSLELEETAETVTTEEVVETTPVVPVPTVKRYPIKELEGKLALIGERTGFAQNGLLPLEWVGSGFVLTVNAPEEGTEVKMNTRFNYESTLLVYVDGELYGDPITLGNGNKETVIANLTAGVHTVKVLKDTQQGTNRNNYNNIVALSFNGEVLESDQTKKDLYLEFIGDGYLTGFGSMGNTAGSAEISKECSFTVALPNLVSQAMDADYSVVAHSQIGLIATSGGFTLPTLYNNHNGYRDLEYFYTPTRVPDAIIIHAGNDDSTTKLILADFITQGEAFIQQIRSYYGEAGKDIPVIWTYGTVYYTRRSSEIQAIALRNDNVYALQLEYGQNGSGGKETVRYPNAADHQKSADILVPYLKNLLGK